jgi:hypothetical protein
MVLLLDPSVNETTLLVISSSLTFRKPTMKPSVRVDQRTYLIEAAKLRV